MRKEKKLVRKWMVWYLHGTIQILERLDIMFNINTSYAVGSIRRILRELKRL